VRVVVYIYINCPLKNVTQLGYVLQGILMRCVLHFRVVGLTYPKVQYTLQAMRSLLDKVEWRYNPEWSLMEEEEGIWGDDRLSLKAKGIWAYMKSKPSNWDFSAKRIATESKDETKSVQRGMKELEECGYLSKKKLGNGRVHYTLVPESYIGVEPRVDKSSLDDRNEYKYGR